MRMQNAILDKLAAIPGVQSVAFANGAPLEGFNSNDVLWAEDKTYAPGQIPPIRRFRFMSPGYLQTLGTPLIAGRDFTSTDALRHFATWRSCPKTSHVNYGAVRPPHWANGFEKA